MSSREALNMKLPPIQSTAGAVPVRNEKGETEPLAGGYRRAKLAASRAAATVVFIIEQYTDHFLHYSLPLFVWTITNWSV